MFSRRRWADFLDTDLAGDDVVAQGDYDSGEQFETAMFLVRDQNPQLSLVAIEFPVRPVSGVTRARVVVGELGLGGPVDRCHSDWLGHVLLHRCRLRRGHRPG